MALTQGCKHRRDAFQRRERANEDWAIKQREKEKLMELKKKLAEQQAHLKQLSDHMYVCLLDLCTRCQQEGWLGLIRWPSDEITKEQGGEHN